MFHLLEFQVSSIIVAKEGTGEVKAGLLAVWIQYLSGNRAKHGLEIRDELRAKSNALLPDVI